MLTAKQLAQKIKKDEQEEKRKEKTESERISKYRDAEKAKLAGWIEEVLGSFKLTVKKQWFAGDDYWTLSRKKKILCSCVLSFKCGTWRPSDECEVEYAEWEIAVCVGAWEGPHHRSGMQTGITTLETLTECVAEIMSKQI